MHSAFQTAAHHASSTCRRRLLRCPLLALAIFANKCCCHTSRMEALSTRQPLGADQLKRLFVLTVPGNELLRLPLRLLLDCQATLDKVFLAFAAKIQLCQVRGQWLIPKRARLLHTNHLEAQHQTCLTGFVASLLTKLRQASTSAHQRCDHLCP